MIAATMREVLDEHATSSRRGSVDLAVPGCGAINVTRSTRRSVVTQAYAASPLRLLTPRNHGHAAWVYTSTYGGGLVDGDHVALNVVVSEGATMLLATQAATKVYRSPRGTSSSLDAIVEDNGLLVVAPDPVICFARATFSQHQRFDLRRGASLVYLDWLTSGRHASGERWLFDRYESRLEIRNEGRLTALDSTVLSGEDGDIASRMGRFEVIAVVAVYGTVLTSHAAAMLERVKGRAVERQAPLLVGASPLRDGGCLLRVAGTNVEQVAHVVRDELSFVPGLLGDDPWARKW